MAKPGVQEEEDDQPDEDNMQWRIANRHYFMQNNATITCAAFHAPSNLLVTGFSNGIFTIHELPDFTEIHTLR
jgi:periodic tryptophan protein 2